MALNASLHDREGRERGGCAHNYDLDTGACLSVCFPDPSRTRPQPDKIGHILLESMALRA